MPIESRLLSRVVHAAYAGTLTILYNDNNEPVGFVCWAGVNKDSVRIAEKFNCLPTMRWEFKEGNIAMLLEVFFTCPFRREARAAFRRFLASRRAIYYVRKERKRLIIRTSTGPRFAKVN
jgi:hemolysin-activating ACP:hemolysin acyltransferase